MSLQLAPLSVSLQQNTYWYVCLSICLSTCLSLCVNIFVCERWRGRLMVMMI